MSAGWAGGSCPAEWSFSLIFRSPSTSLRGCDFKFPCSLWPESSEEHLQTSIAGVLRLRAVNPLLCNRSARRFAQDDAFLEGTKKHLVGAKSAKRSKKSQALGMKKRTATLP